jgi:hypothetical protein
MEDIRFSGKPEFEIKNPGFVSVLRNKDFTFEYKKGKKWHSFIYVERGGLEYRFNKNEKNLVVNKGDLLFVPRKMPYKTTYLRDCTLLKIFTFDASTSITGTFVNGGLDGTYTYENADGKFKTVWENGKCTSITAK